LRGEFAKQIRRGNLILDLVRAKAHKWVTSIPRPEGRGYSIIY